jgi:hypothetical protein
VTYAQLVSILRFDLLAEADNTYWSDADLFEFLRRAATEIAYEMAFPTAVVDIAVAGGATSFNLPADAATAQLNEVTFGPLRLSLAPVATIREYQGMPSLKFPRHYNTDPKRNPVQVLVAPAAPAAGGTATVEYIKTYDSSQDQLSDEPWDGLFPRFHELIAYRAAVKAFESSLEEDRAGYMQQRSQQIQQAFALFLGKSDVATAIAGPGVSAS